MSNASWAVVIVGGAAVAYLIYKSSKPKAAPAVVIAQAQAPSSQALVAAAEATAINTGIGALSQIVSANTSISGIDDSTDYGD